MITRVLGVVVVVSLVASAAWVMAGRQHDEARFDVEFYCDDPARAFSGQAAFELEYVPQLPVPFVDYRWGSTGGVLDTPTITRVTRTVWVTVADPRVKTLAPGHYQLDVARYLLGGGAYQLHSVVVWPAGKEGRELAMASPDLAFPGSEVYGFEALFPKDDSVPSPGKRFLFRTLDAGKARFLAY